MNLLGRRPFTWTVLRYYNKKCSFVSQLFQPHQDIRAKDSLEIVSRSQKLLSSLGLIENSQTGAILLPYLVRSLEKLIKVIDEEMESIGAQKIIMPSLASISLFEQSGRWDSYKNDVYTVDKEMLLSPTHEEVITKMISKHKLNYKQRLLLYQITTKFRKEKRPRSGLLRAREFLMKDLYSFDAGYESAVQTYQTVCNSYERIFERLNLPVIKVVADPGDMGGQYSHEYQLLTDAGQDDVMICSSCGHCFNEELVIESNTAQSRNEDQTTIRSESESRPNEDKEEKNWNRIKCLNCGSESTESRKGIEVGHTFLLGTRYTQPFQACFNVPSSAANSQFSNSPSDSSSQSSAPSSSRNSLPCSPSSEVEEREGEEGSAALESSSSSEHEGGKIGKKE